MNLFKYYWLLHVCTTVCSLPTASHLFVTFRAIIASSLILLRRNGMKVSGRLFSIFVQTKRRETIGVAPIAPIVPHLCQFKTVVRCKNTHKVKNNPSRTVYLLFGTLKAFINKLNIDNMIAPRTSFQDTCFRAS